MANLQKLARLLSGGKGLSLSPSPTRSALVQRLMEQSGQQRGSGSPVESLNIAATPIIAALLGKREEKARAEQERLTSGRQQALSAALARSRDESLTPEVREAARRASQTIAAGLPPDNPVVQSALQEQFSDRQQKRETQTKKELLAEESALRLEREDAARAEARIVREDEQAHDLELAAFNRETDILEAQVKASAKGGDSFSQNQFVAAGYGQRVLDSNSIFDSLDATEKDFTSFWNRVQQRLPRGAKSEERQMFEQSERNFINATLRRESGAVISEDEFVNAREQYIPQPGDSDKTLLLKKRNRQVVQASLVAEAGGALDVLRDNLPPIDAGTQDVQRPQLRDPSENMNPGDTFFNEFGQKFRVTEDGMAERIPGVRGGKIQRN